MNKKVLILTTACALICNSAFAQTKKDRDIQNAIFYLEMGRYSSKMNQNTQPYVWKSNKIGIELLKDINNSINERIRYVEPVDNIWKIPREVYKYGGACADYALLKAYELQNQSKDKSISKKDMSLLIGFLKPDDKYMHAVLQVDYKNKPYYLDVNSNDINKNPLLPGYYIINII